MIPVQGATRVALMLTPEPAGTLGEQLPALLLRMQSLLQQQSAPMMVTTLTIFLREAQDRAQCEVLLAEHFRGQPPVMTLVQQPPGNGAAVALEAWAIGGDQVQVERFGKHAVAVSYNGARYIHCGGLVAGGGGDAYAQALVGLEGLRGALECAGTGFEDMVRTWFFLGDITGASLGKQRYQEFNRARTDVYQGIGFSSLLAGESGLGTVYPASTGIGMAGRDVAVGCLAVQASPQHARLVPLENPRQTPACNYPRSCSAQSPKFSRATALIHGNELTIWISGTASIVESETRHVGDLAKQVEETLDNIASLISPANLAAQGIAAGAQLADLAKMRVYLKRAEDYAACKAICDRRAGGVPAIYAVADVCRPELLVEIEGVAFLRLPKRAQS